MHNILITFLKPDLKGGGQRSTLIILDGIGKRDFNPIAVIPSEGEIAAYCRNKGYNYEIIDLPPIRIRNLFLILNRLYKIAKIIKRYEVDIIHSDCTRYSLYFGIISKLFRVPLISHVRVSTPEPLFIEFLLYTLSNKVIAVSYATAERFAKFRGFAKKVKVVYNAVDTVQYTPEKRQGILRRKLHINDEILVGIIGEITHWKGQDDFIAAAKIVVSKFKKIAFVIIGSGDSNYMKHLNEMVRMQGLEHYVFFMNFIEDISTVLPDLDILVNASKFVKEDGGPEGFSRIIIEAMASGVAVIASDSGGNKEAVNDVGLLFPPGDISKLAESILELAKDKERRKEIGRALRIRCRRLFSLPKHIDRMIQIYQEVL